MGQAVDDLSKSRSHPSTQLDAYDTVGSIATKVADGFTMVAVGDLIVSRALTQSQHPGFDAVVIRSFGGSP